MSKEMVIGNPPGSPAPAPASGPAPAPVPAPAPAPAGDHSAGAAGATPAANIPSAGQTPAGPSAPSGGAPAPAAGPAIRRARRLARPGARRAAGSAGLGVLSLAGGIGLWALAVGLGLSALPGPAEVGRRMLALAASGQLAGDMAASLRRVLIGFALGAGVAVPVGFLMGWYRIARALIEPWIQFLRVIPPLAIIPLAIVTLGIDEKPKIFVIFLAAFLSSVVATYQGVVNVDRTYINAARVLGASDRVIFLRVVIPASTPFILVGFRIALGSAWATVVAAELIAAQSGLGFRMQQAQLYYDLPTIFVSLIAIGVLGLVMDRVVVHADARLTRWQERA